MLTLTSRLRNLALRHAKIPISCLPFGHSHTVKCGRACVHLSFNTMGDIMHAPLLATLVESYLCHGIISGITLAEEYQDFGELLRRSRELFDLDPRVEIEMNVRGHVLVGCYDTAVAAYTTIRKPYDHVIPTQCVRPLHFTDLEVSDQSAIRCVLGITPTDSVVVLSSLSCMPPGNLLLSHDNGQIQHDFEVTNQARYIPTDGLALLVSLILKSGIAEKVIVVPRNITEEVRALEIMADLSAAVIVNEATESVREEWCAMIVLAKGILRTLYSIADIAVVFGWHNIMEPYQANGRIQVLCFAPPRNAPNHEMWICGDRLGLLKSLPPTAPRNRCAAIYEALKTPWSGKRFDRTLYLADNHVQNAGHELKASLDGLVRIIESRAKYSPDRIKRGGG